jgi:NADH:ubiquinone oxidoreductase subunit 6 (subunit J)
MSRRRRTTNTNPTSTVATVASAAVIVLCFAVAMLGHATRADRLQWAEGAFTASVVTLSAAVFVAIVTTVWAIQDDREQRQIEAAMARLRGH